MDNRNGVNNKQNNFNKKYQEEKRMHRNYQESYDNNYSEHNYRKNNYNGSSYRENDSNINSNHYNSDRNRGRNNIKNNKKNNKVIITSVICLLLVLGGAFATFRVAQYEKEKQFQEDKKEAQEAAIEDSQKALVSYYKCIQAKDYSRLYGGVDKNTKTKRAEDNFIFVNKAFYNKISMEEISIAIKSCNLNSKENKSDNNESKTSTTTDKYDASNTVIEYTTTIKTDGGEFSFDNTANMIKEDDVWHVVWNSNLIYPDYEPLDVVTTTYASTYRGSILDRDGNVLAKTENNQRVYPRKNEAAHLVGFVSKITDAEIKERSENGEEGYSTSSIVGKKGLEYAFESKIKGSGGQKITLSDSKGNVKKVLLESEPTKGEDLKTTINMKIQSAIYNEIKNDNACSVAINPYTGEILALVSTPSYDNNGVLKGTAKDTYNRFARTFCPGSTFKSITGAVGLECGAFTKDTNFGRSSMRWQKDKSWGDLYVTTTHASNGTLKNALTVSDNVYFAKAALKIGSSKMKSGLDKIGFNEELPIEMNFTPSQYSNSETFTSEAMLANSGYGQGQILVNPLHMATIYSAFVNEGNMIKPVFQYNGKAEFWKSNVFKKENAETILDGLKNVVKSGTATRLYSSRVTVAGKTGTAEIKASQDDKTGTELGWFVAITPDVDKEDAVLIVTMVENVKNRGGSSYVVTKTRNMLKKIYSNY